LKGAEGWKRDPLEALRAGDRAPFEAFVQSETITFLAFFRRLGAGPTEAEDLVQETFLKLFRTVQTYQPSGRFAAYAFRVARNAWIDQKRRRASAPGAGAEGRAGAAAAAEEEDIPLAWAEAREGEAGPLERAERAEEAGRIRSAVQELNEGHRRVFELAVVEGLPYGEIAALLGIPEGTVKSRMHHALRKLRGRLEDSGESEGVAG
jgi:RNA polymerase sigma-70 factor (ECF subfamily)